MDLNAKIAARRQELAALAKEKLLVERAELRAEAARTLEALGVKDSVPPVAGEVAPGATVSAQVNSAINAAATRRFARGDWAGVVFALGAAIALFFNDSAALALLLVAGVDGCQNPRIFAAERRLRASVA